MQLQGCMRYSMTFAWMGTYSAEGNSLQMDFDEGALYLGDIEAVEFFINFFAEELGSDELLRRFSGMRLLPIFGGTPERGWTIAANISSDSGNLVFSFPGPDGIPGPDGTANTLRACPRSRPHSRGTHQLGRPKRQMVDNACSNN